MKKLIALLLCLMLALPVFAMADDTVEITLWTYPIGSWGNAETVDGIIANFTSLSLECCEIHGINTVTLSRSLPP